MLLEWAPPRLGDPDASLFAAYARRMLSGQVPYLDFETYFSPGTLGLLAALFRAFGVDVQVARALNAATYAGLVGVLYAIVRSLGVGRSFALLACAAQLGWAYPMWPHLSPHWIGSLALASVLLALSRDWRRVALSYNVLQGALLGVLVVLQHHKGSIAAILLAAYLALDARIRDPRVEDAPGALRRFVWIVLGSSLVAVPVFGSLLLRTGASAFLDGLVVGPLVRYPRFPLAQFRWSDLWLQISAVVGRLPLELTTPIGRGFFALALWMGALVACLWRLHRSGEAGSQRRWLFVAFGVVVFGLVNGYRSALVLQAFVFPGTAVAVAALLGDLDTRWKAGAGRSSLALASAAAAVVLLAAAFLSVRQARSEFPARAETAFGTIALPSREAARATYLLLARTRELGLREIYCHTYCSELGLVLGLSNPSRFELLLPGMSPAADYDEVLRLLEQRDDAYVGVGWIAATDPSDRVLPWIVDRYQKPIDLPDPLPLSRVLVRKDIARELWDELLSRSRERPPGTGDGSGEPEPDPGESERSR